MQQLFLTVFSVMLFFSFQAQSLVMNEQELINGSFDLTFGPEQQIDHDEALSLLEFTMNEGEESQEARQLNMNKLILDILRRQWPKAKVLYQWTGDEDTVCFEIPKELILKIIHDMCFAKDCYFYSRGLCKNGDLCPYRHGPGSGKDKKQRKKEAREKKRLALGFYLCAPPSGSRIEEGKPAKLRALPAPQKSNKEYNNRPQKQGERKALPAPSFAKNNNRYENWQNWQQKQWNEHVGRMKNFRRKPCKYFQAGTCRRGNNCTYLHVAQQPRMMPHNQYVPQNSYPYTYYPQNYEQNYIQIPVIDSSYLPYMPLYQPWQVIIMYDGVPTYSEYYPQSFSQYYPQPYSEYYAQPMLPYTDYATNYIVPNHY